MNGEGIAGVNGPWPVLNTNERRVLGVLVEKSKTTPDAYPLSVNSVVTGSNQKSNRDPIFDIDEDEALDALMACKNKGLVIRVTGTRVERWRHQLYEAWAVDKVELALLAELLLRGPQTEGELRTRASRMEPIEDLDALRLKLKPLTERGLVVYLTPEDRRGAMLSHGFHDPAELAQLKKQAASGAPAATVSASVAVAAPAPKSDDRVPGLMAEVSALRDELSGALTLLHKANERIEALEKLSAELRVGVAVTRDELQTLKRSLGE